MAIDAAQISVIKKELEKMIQALVKLGVLSPNTDVKALADRVTNKMKDDPNLFLSPEMMKNDSNVFKSLQLACIAESNPANKFDYTILLKKDLERDGPEFKEQFKAIFTDILRLSPQYDKRKTPEEEEELIKQLEGLAEIAFKKMENEPNNLQNFLGHCLAVLSGLFDAKQNPEEAFNRMLTGVGKMGEVFQPTPDYSIGDQIGVVNYITYGKSFLGEKNSPDPGAADPLGIKLATMINFLAAGQTNQFEETAQALGLTQTTTPVLKPPHSQGNH